jgi:hypothetical protein
VAHLTYETPYLFGSHPKKHQALSRIQNALIQRIPTFIADIWISGPRGPLYTIQFRYAQKQV